MEQKTYEQAVECLDHLSKRIEAAKSRTTYVEHDLKTLTEVLYLIRMDVDSLRELIK